MSTSVRVSIGKKATDLYNFNGPRRQWHVRDEIRRVKRSRAHQKSLFIGEVSVSPNKRFRNFK